ncbi:ferritin family protein [Myxococcota bacterium]|nr:ferritin family protein [Myxococcota bacterium]
MSFSNFKEIVEFAIKHEQSAASLYELMAQKAEGAGLKKFFLELVTVEKGHEARLRQILEGKMGGFGAAVVDDMKITEIALNIKLSPTTSYQDALLFAMRAEKAAVELYESLAAKAEDAELREIFKTLADEERQHKNHFEKEYDEDIMSDN